MATKATVKRAEIVSFGCLKKVLVQPENGINLLSLPNESGKTTFAAFVKFMLYGFAGTRLASVADNEKKRFMPWDGSNAEGSLEISLGDKTYRITRVSSSSPRDKVTCVLLPSGEAVFEGMNIGEQLFGVGEELFTKTAFFRELQMPHSSDATLASEIKNISVLSEDKAAADRAKKRLTEAKNELGNRQKHGIYYDVKAKLEEAEQKYGRALSVSAEISSADEKIQSYEKIISDDDTALERLSAELAQIERFEADRTVTRLRSFDAEVEVAEKKYAEAVKGFDFSTAENGLFAKLSEKYEKYSGIKTEKSICDRRLASCEMDIASKMRGTKLTEATLPQAEKAIKSDSTGKKLVILGAVTAVILVGIIFIIIGLSMRSKAKKICAELGYASMDELAAEYKMFPEILSSINALYKSRDSLQAEVDEADRKAAEAAKEIEELISSCCASDPSLQFSEQIERIRAAFNKAEMLKNSLNMAKNARDKAYEGIDIEALEKLAESFDGVTPARDRRAVEHEIAFCRTQKEKISPMLADIKKDKAVLLSSAGDAALMKGKVDALRDRLTRIENRGNSLALALQTLEEAGEYIKSAVAPMINDVSGRNFSLLTDGKYDSLTARGDLKLSADDGFAKHECDSLSAGARECAGISLRFALSDIMYPDASVPIFLDDALVHLDDKRLINMMKLLGEYAEKHQIFIISCSERYARALKEAGITYSLTELKQC